MKLLQRWKQTAIHNKLLVWTGIFVAFGTIFYAGAAAFQICLMKRASKHTDEQIGRIIANANWLARSMDYSVKESSTSLNVSQRAYLVALSSNIDQSSKSLVFGLNNIGHLPSTDGHIKLFEMTFMHGKSPFVGGFPIGRKIEGHWVERRIPDVTYITPALIQTSLPALDMDLFSNLKIGVICAGEITYHDGFPDSPQRTLRLCGELFYDAQRKSVSSISCDPISITKIIKSGIGYPRGYVREAP